MDVFDRVASRIPESVRGRLRTTPADTVYGSVRRSAVGSTIAYRTAEFATVTTETPVGTVTLETRPGNWLTVEAQNEGGHEPMLTKALATMLSPESVYYDIGAHHGYTVTIAQLCGVDDENIHCFDVDRFNTKVLARNCGEEINITCARVGPESGSNSVSIDSYVETNPEPDLVKIDVEGHETDVIRGMKRVMEVVGPTIFVELHPNRLRRYGSSVDTVTGYLPEHGYRLEMIDHREYRSEWVPVSDPVVETKTEAFLVKAAK